ncbi:MAG: Cys-tRNA(Pro) deacylase [Draconibacterium sp.]
MNSKLKKTNAARLLDNKKVNYKIVEYVVDEADLSAIHVAAMLGENVEQVFKTLVLRGNANGIFVAIVPGGAEVNLKKAAKVSGNKNAEMVAMKELLGLTGYIRGACSPLGMKKPYPMFIHETCLNFEYVFVSAGKRGMQLKLNPVDLISCASATTCNLTDS